MIIRVFLFLLAMLTGVSAAQAAGNLQLTPSVIGSTTQSAAKSGAPSATSESLSTASAVHWSTVKYYVALSKKSYFPAPQSIVVTPTTQRSDRARE